MQISELICLGVPNDTLRRLYEAGGLKALLEHFRAMTGHVSYCPRCEAEVICECEECETAMEFLRKLEGE